MDRLQADKVLAAIGALEHQMAEVEELCHQEQKLIEEYRSRELERLQKKRAWLVFNLEAWVRTTGEKTIRLIHGICKLRKGRDKVEIVSMDLFLKVGSELGLVRTVPEQVEPDIRAISRVRQAHRGNSCWHRNHPGRKRTFHTQSMGRPNGNDEQRRRNRRLNWD